MQGYNKVTLNPGLISGWLGIKNSQLMKYENGSANNGLLICPAERIAQSETGGNMLLKDARIKLNAYPNPFYSTSTIEFLLAKDDDVKLEVYDLKGSQIATLFTGKAQGNAPVHVEFNVGNLAPGMYICMLRTTNGTYYHRLMFVNQQ